MKPNVKDPSFVSALIYFDFAAHYLSFSEAAEEIGVTPSAVSYRIAALEEAIGKRLFIRETRSVRLTPEGGELAQVTRRLFDELGKTTKRVAEQKSLRVSAGPYLSSSWLMRRLNQFEAHVPGLRIDLIYAVGPVDLRKVDVSVLWADSNPPPEHGTRLLDTLYVPVTSPALEYGERFWETPLLPLHFRTRQPWRHWLKAAGAPASYADKGEIFDDPNLVLEAAAQARGVAIGILPLVKPMIEAGHLKPVHTGAFDSKKSFWILVSDRSNELAISFETWLLEQTDKL